MLYLCTYVADGSVLLYFYVLSLRFSWQALKLNKYDGEPMLRSCGVSISTQFTQVEGRVLPAPRVEFSVVELLLSVGTLVIFLTLNMCTVISVQLKVGNGEDFFPRNGRWNFNNKVRLVPVG